MADGSNPYDELQFLHDEAREGRRSIPPCGAIGFMSAAALDGKPVPEREWTVPDWVPRGNVTLLYGDGGTGKSLAALQMAVAVATGRAWFGRPVTAGRAAFLSAEDDDAELHRRLASIAEAEGITMAAMHRLSLKSLAGQDALLASLSKDGRLIRSPLFYALDQFLGEARPELLVLDTLADLFPGNENDRAQARQFVGILRHLAITHRCAVVMLAHPSLSGLNSGSGTSGSTGWSNSSRSRLYLERVTQEGYEADPDARVLHKRKANYGRTGEEIALRWQAGVFVAQEAEQGLDRCAANAKAERVFLRLLREHTDQGRRVNANGGSRYAPKVFAEHHGSEGVTKRAFRAAMERLLSDGRLQQMTEGPASRPVTFIAEVSL